MPSVWETDEKIHKSGEIMVNRQNYKDVKDYLDYHQKNLLNKSNTVDLYERQLKHALIWSDEILFSEYNKNKITLPQFLIKEINENIISERFGADVCNLFRDFMRFEISENKSRYGWIKESQLKEIRIIKHSDTTKKVKYYSLEDMQRISDFHPVTLLQKRTQASAVFLFLSGMRIGAYLSMPIKCVDLSNRSVFQFPELGVMTKFSKKAQTSLLNIPFLLNIVFEWRELLKNNNIPSDALWHSQIDQSGSGKSLVPVFPTIGNHTEGIRAATRRESHFRDDLVKLCSLCGVEYKNPHAFRHGHIHFGLSRVTNMEQFKAISQNVMHNSTTITDAIYSRMDNETVSNVISGLTVEKENNLQDSKRNLTTDLLAGLSKEEKIELLKELLSL